MVVIPASSTRSTDTGIKARPFAESASIARVAAASLNRAFACNVPVAGLRYLTLTSRSSGMMADRLAISENLRSRHSPLAASARENWAQAWMVFYVVEMVGRAQKLQRGRSRGSVPGDPYQAVIGDVGNVYHRIYPCSEKVPEMTTRYYVQKLIGVRLYRHPECRV